MKNRLGKRHFVLVAVALAACIFMSACGQTAGESGAVETDAISETSAPSQEVRIPETNSGRVKGTFSLGGVYADEDGYDVMEYGNYPHMAGIPSCEVLQAALASELLGIPDENLDSFIDTSDKEYLLQEFFQKTTVGIISYQDEAGNYTAMEPSPYNLLLTTALTEQEWEEYGADGNAQVAQTPVAADALVFYVSHQNPVNGLTAAQARGIYTGDVINWSDVGGDDVEILAYQSYDDLEQLDALVLDGKQIIEPIYESMLIPDGSGGGNDYEIEVAVEYTDAPESIGFGCLSLLQWKDDIKILEIDGVLPQMGALDSYPFGFTYYALYYEDDDIPREFVAWLTSQEGREIVVANYGYALPLAA